MEKDKYGNADVTRADIPVYRDQTREVYTGARTEHFLNVWDDAEAYERQRPSLRSRIRRLLDRITGAPA